MNSSFSDFDEPVEYPINGELDLHGFDPKEIKDLVPDYLRECQKRGILNVRVVHGKGVGNLRRSVHAILSRMPEVVSFAQAGAEFGHWGATIVQLRPATVSVQSFSMLIVHVHVRVKPECAAAFKEATIENARQSILEPGIARFDVIQQTDDSTRFVLVEVYRTAEAPAVHKETAHYKKWRDTVAEMMAEPRSSVKYVNLFPSDESW